MRELALSSGKQVLPFLLLIGFSLLGSLSFCLLVRYNEAETHLPDGAGPGVCVDAYNASFVRAFYFTSTVFSSIGYGDVVPCTWAGKLVTMSLALMGVPLTLFCLGRLGSLLRKLLDRLWRTLACHYCRNGSGKEVRPLLLPLAKEETQGHFSGGGGRRRRGTRRRTFAADGGHNHDALVDPPLLCLLRHLYVRQRDRALFLELLRRCLLHC